MATFYKIFRLYSQNSELLILPFDSHHTVIAVVKYLILCFSIIIKYQYYTFPHMTVLLLLLLNVLLYLHTVC